MRTRELYNIDGLVESYRFKFAVSLQSQDPAIDSSRTRCSLLLRRCRSALLIIMMRVATLSPLTTNEKNDGGGGARREECFGVGISDWTAKKGRELGSAWLGYLGGQSATSIYLATATNENPLHAFDIHPLSPQ